MSMPPMLFVQRSVRGLPAGFLHCCDVDDACEGNHGDRADAMDGADPRARAGERNLNDPDDRKRCGQDQHPTVAGPSGECRHKYEHLEHEHDKPDRLVGAQRTGSGVEYVGGDEVDLNRDPDPDRGGQSRLGPECSYTHQHLTVRPASRPVNPAAMRLTR